MVPFLYQTATIQQWKPTRQPVPYRNASSRSDIDQDIPFESEIESPHSQDAAPPRKSTITGPERAAFKGLYKSFRTQGPRSPANEVVDKDDEHDGDEAARDADATSIDLLFESVLSNQPHGPRPRVPGPHKDDLGALAKQILKPGESAAEREAANAKKERAAKIKNLQASELARVGALLGAAQTDRELWAVLEKEVFDVMRNMKLDEKGPQGKKQHKKGDKKTPSVPNVANPPPRFPTKPSDAPFDQIDVRDPIIFFPIFPSHIINATKILVEDFPSSPLPFTMIPALKSLGRSAYILGATKQLFTAVLRATWLRQHSYSHMCALLQDMSNSGVEPDHGTLTLLDEILEEYRIGRKGKLGPGVSAVWEFKPISESVNQLTRWRDGIAERLRVGAPRGASGAAVRKHFDFRGFQPFSPSAYARGKHEER